MQILLTREHRRHNQYDLTSEFTITDDEENLFYISRNI